MLDGHDIGICKDLLWEVVYELAVDKAVDAMGNDGLDFVPHLLLFCFLNICHLAYGRASEIG